MSVDFALPTTTTPYNGSPNVLSDISDKNQAVAIGFETGTYSNLPTGAKRLNPTTKDPETWNGSAWVDYDPRLRNHLANTSNPHSVTAAQVGAPTTTDFNAHVSNSSNPHSTTASQVGAPSLSAFNAHASSTSNPHSTTAAQVGAPALANNLSDLPDKAAARSNLVLGSIATQNANAVTITGGSISVPVTNVPNSGFLGPSTDLGANLGSVSQRFAGAYIGTVVSGINDTGGGDLTIEVNGTPWWIFGGTNKDLRPASNGTQRIGFPSFWWSEGYIDSIVGRATSIHLSDGADAHIRYVAGTSGEHYFYDNAGSQLLFAIQNNGKVLFNVAGRPAYTISGSISTVRTLNVTPDLTQVQQTLATLIRDLKNTGIVQ